MSGKSTRTRKWILGGAALALLIALAPVAATAESEETYKRSPGYVDFDPILGDMESSVEVFLKGSLLVIAREAVRDEDPELGDLLSKISYVRVQVFRQLLHHLGAIHDDSPEAGPGGLQCDIGPGDQFRRAVLVLTTLDARRWP